MYQPIKPITRQFLFDVASASGHLEDPRMTELMAMYKRLDYLGDASEDEIEAFDEIIDSIEASI